MNYLRLVVLEPQPDNHLQYHHVLSEQAKPKQERKAARWVLLGTFLYAA